MNIDPAIQAAIIGSLTTVVAGVGGLGVLIWRLRVEAQHAIDESKTTEAMKLKLKIYEQEVVKTVEMVVDAEVALSGFVRRFISELKNHRTLSTAGLPATAPVARVPALIDLKAVFDRAAVEIVTFTERWFVIDPRFEFFRTAINAAMHDVNFAYWPYFHLVLPWMPAELPAGLHWAAPSTDVFDAINVASDTLLESLGTVTAYASDFQAEMQNVLIGPLFGHTVPRRQPIDPRYRVISLENHVTLARYFEDDTAWGRYKKEIEAGARAAVSGAR